jgi:putative ABC transport system permease protein
MLKTYIKIAWRSLRKNRLYTAVNMIGLTLGIASCLLIGIYILNELSYDRFHKNGTDIVRVTMEYNGGNAVTKTAVTGTKVGPEFSRSFPEVQSFVRTYKYPVTVGYQEKVFEEKQFLFADSTFFSIFSFPLVEGNAQTALNAPDKIVLSQSTARKYFGNESAIGKTLRVGDNRTFIVSAVAADCPNNSQIKFDFIAAFTSLNASKREDWWTANYYTYLQLKPGTNLALFSNRVAAFMKQVTTQLDMGPAGYLTYHLEPLLSVHLHSLLDALEPGNNIVYIYVLALVAILILIIACINYTNLATAQSTKRIAEIGVRKVLGAEKSELFRQFIGESILITFIAILTSVLIAYILLPYFNTLTSLNFTPADLAAPRVLLLLLVLWVSVGFLSGAYPALLLSNLQLAKVLKSGFSFTSKGNGLRKSLIVLQFTISLFLIIVTVIIIQQLSYIRNKDLGYNKDHIIVLPVDHKMLPNYDAIKQAIAAVPGVIKVTGAYEGPQNIQWGDGLSKGEGKQNSDISVNAIPVDEDFVSTLNLKIIAGSDYTRADVQQIDTSNGGANLHFPYILNESAVRALGWKPEEAIGQTISKNVSGVVKAVVKDFHFKSLHETISPLVIFLDKSSLQVMMVKIDGKSTAQTLSQLENTWKQRVGHRPFEYHFLDEDYNALYQNEQRTAGIFSTFSAIAIMLACLGLFALTAYAVVQRTKEIGIRKVLGAGITDIIGLLSKDFLLLVGIALLIACPLAWTAGNKWLQAFSYRISINWWVFIAAGLATLIIALLTISLQAVKAARANPVESLHAD